MKTLLLAALLSSVATVALAGADLVLTTDPSVVFYLAGGARNTLKYSILNNGPDEARDVVFTLTFSPAIVVNPCAAGCAVGTVPVGRQIFSIDIDIPNTVDRVVISASVTSSTPDPNLIDNNLTRTFGVSPNPDVVVRLFAPSKVDLAFAFPLTNPWS